MAASHPVDGAPGALFSSDRPWIYGLTWVVYASGALAGGFLFFRAGAAALALPIAAILAASAGVAVA